MSSSAKDRSGSQNNSERPSSSRTSTAACSELPQRFCTVPLIPANWSFQCPSLTRTTVPLRASLTCKSLGLLCPSLLGSEQLRCPRSPHHALPSQHYTRLGYHRPDVSR